LEFSERKRVPRAASEHLEKWRKVRFIEQATQTIQIK